MRKQDIVKILFGFLFIALGIYLYINDLTSTIALAKSFSEEPIEIVGLSFKAVTDSQIPTRVIMKSHGIDLEIRQAKIVNGYWEVFENVAGWGEGSGVPGEKGNQVIFAHAKRGLFLSLRNAKKDDIITIHTNEKVYEYVVTEVKEVSPTDTSVIGSTEEELLTLYTCSGFKDSKRFIVIGKRLAIE